MSGTIRDPTAISVKKIFGSIDKAQRQADQVVELFKRNGVNFKKESKYDFSDIKSKLISSDGNYARVQLKGSYVFDLGEKNRKVIEVDRIVLLKKINGFYYYAGSESGENIK